MCDKKQEAWDRFASHALQAMITYNGMIGHDIKNGAKLCSDFADAMIAEREKRIQDNENIEKIDDEIILDEILKLIGAK